MSTVMPAGVGLDGVEQPLPQPRHVARTAAGARPRAARGRAAPRRSGRSRPSPNAATFCGHQRGDAGRAERQADVGGRHDLPGQAAEALPDLGAEHQAADLVHDPGRAGCRRRPAPRSLLGRDARWTSRRRPGRRPGRTAPPHRQRLSSHSTRVHVSTVCTPRGQVGDLVEPQVGQADGSATARPVGRADTRGVRAGRGSTRPAAGRGPS